MSTLQELSLQQLVNHLNEDDMADRFWALKTRVSLRRIQHFVWIWCKENGCLVDHSVLQEPVCVDTNESPILRARNLFGEGSPEVYTAIHENYMCVLSAERKDRFDAFARGKKTQCQIGGDIVKTTIAQLSFFHWFLVNRIDYTLFQVVQDVKTSLSEFNRKAAEKSMERKRKRSEEEDTSNKIHRQLEEQDPAETS